MRKRVASSGVAIFKGGVERALQPPGRTDRTANLFHRPLECQLTGLQQQLWGREPPDRIRLQPYFGPGSRW